MRGTSAAPPAGWVRVDCHLHTVASGDAVLTLEQLAERAQQAGLTWCASRTHVTAARARERDLGAHMWEEVRTGVGDVIGLFESGL